MSGANGLNEGAVPGALRLSLWALQGGMAERKEQAHWVVSERDKAESLVETFRVVVCGIQDQGVHGHSLTGGHGPLDRIGEKHAPETTPVRRAVDRQPADQGAGHRIAPQFSG